jgi:hypothetical protein
MMRDKAVTSVGVNYLSSIARSGAGKIELTRAAIHKFNAADGSAK